MTWKCVVSKPSPGLLPPKSLFSLHVEQLVRDVTHFSKPKISKLFPVSYFWLLWSPQAKQGDKCGWWKGGGGQGGCGYRHMTSLLSTWNPLKSWQTEWEDRPCSDQGKRGVKMQDATRKWCDQADLEIDPVKLGTLLVVNILVCKKTNTTEIFLVCHVPFWKFQAVAVWHHMAHHHCLFCRFLRIKRIGWKNF